MQPHEKTWNTEKLLDHEVVDSQGQKIGKLRASWVDERGRPEFLGVKTGWFMGKIHVVPAELAEVSERSERIRLRASADRVKNAPTADDDSELDQDLQQRTCQYYGISRGPYPGAEEAHEEHPGQYLEGQPRGPGEQAVMVEQTETTTPIEHRPPMEHPEHAEETRIPLHEEQLHVEKRSAMIGGVRLRKIVRTETVNQPVELQHEEIVVERVPASEAPTAGASKIEEEEIFIPLRGEVPVVEKSAHLREEVRVRKEQRTREQTVSGEVRREDIEIEHREGQIESDEERERRRRAA